MAHSHDHPVRILLVEDNPGDARLLRALLLEAAPPEWRLVHVLRLADAEPHVGTGELDVVLLDLSLPDAHGLETVDRMRALAPGLPIVVLTGTDDESLAVQAVQAGAQDYLVKGHADGRLLVRAVRYALERHRLERDRLRLLERERAARATAEAAARARDEVLGVVSHDLRNPLSTIGMCAEVLVERPPEDPGERRELLATVQQAVGWMQHIIRDLLDVTSIEAGRLAVQREAQPAGDLLLAAFELLEPQAEARGLRLMLRADAALPAVDADRARVLQVLLNLGGNALKFTPDGGRVTLGARRAGAFVAFAVADTGRGIPAEHLPHVFDRFWQARQGERGGAGLGLAIARGIVEAHGGTIVVESEVGRGTTFTFTIPVVQAVDGMTDALERPGSPSLGAHR